MKKQFLKFLFTALFTVQLGFASSSSEYAVIKGTISIPEAKIKEITIYNVQDGQSAAAAVAKINQTGEFGFMLPITEPGFYYIDYGQFKYRRQLIRLYLDSKSDIEISIVKDGYTLAGKSIGQNTLVQKANELYNDFASYGNMSRNTGYEAFYAFIDQGIAKADALKKSINTKDEKFNKLLKLAIDTDVEELTYFTFRMPSRTFPAKNDRPAVMKQWQKDKRFDDADLLKLANGVSLMSNYFFYMAVNKEPIMKQIDLMPDALKHIVDPSCADAFLRNEITISRMKIEEYEKIAPIIKPYMVSKASKEFLFEYEKVLHKSVGQKGLEFTYKDTNDKAVSFSDFKGKYVYIDLWATWCGPCKAEIPHMKKLEEDYHDKNIVFVSLSLDAPKDLQKWKDFVKKEQLKGIQLVADKAFDSDVAKNYEVKAIPRFLLFDTNGKIINSDALRPSNPELRAQFDKLLKG